jgi:hypothetical protein
VFIAENEKIPDPTESESDSDEEWRALMVSLNSEIKIYEFF